MMVARVLVGLWLLAYGKFRIRGVRMLIRLFYPFSPSLKRYPLAIPGLGTVYIDLGQDTAYSLLLRLGLRDLGTDKGLYEAMERFLKPQGTLWDVGGFAGYISAYFADPKCQLSSIQIFEPNPASIAHLRKLFAQCPLVRLHPFALGSTDTTMELSVAVDSASTASLIQQAHGAPKVSVQVRCGDRAQQELNLPLPDVIKIDVEGFEAEVLKGLNETIARKRPVIVFEHIFLSDPQITQLVPGGHKLLFIGDDSLIYEGLASRTKGHDALLVPSDHPALAGLVNGKH